MALTKVSRGLLSTGIVDNSNATAITINADESVTLSSTLAVTSGVTSGSHLINAASSAFGASSVQGFNTDFLIDTGQGYARHNSYHTGGSNHQFLVNEASSTTNAVALSISKDKTAIFNGKVGFGITPTQLIHGKTASGNAYMRIERASQSAGQVGLQIGGGTTDWFTYIPASSNDLAFFGNSAERIRLEASGAMLLGTNSVISGAGGSGAQLFVKQAVSSNGISSVANSNNHYVRMLHTGTIGKIESTYGTGSYTPLAFFTSGGERLRILSTGGITFNGETAAASALSSYETGTWTIGLENSSGASTTPNNSTKSGRYVKVGNLVHVAGYYINTSLNGVTGHLRLKGLPFAAAANDVSYSTLNFAYGVGWNLTAGTNPTAYVTKGTKYCWLNQWNAATGTNLLSNAHVTDSVSFIFSGTYYTDE